MKRIAHPEPFPPKWTAPFVCAFARFALSTHCIVSDMSPDRVLLETSLELSRAVNVNI